MELKADYLIAGAGFSGLVIAERLTNVLGKSVLIVEKRPHIGGNCHDYYDSAGVLVHKYGPHYFRTNSDKIIDYLSRFTGWHPVSYQIKSFTHGRYWSFPINLNTFEEYIGRKSTEDEFAEWIRLHRVAIDHPENSEEIIISQVGVDLYKLFFEGYTYKQWRKHPRELDPSVCGRIPVRTNRNNNYLNERFQALPDKGYHVLFNNMVASMGNRAKLLLNTNYRDILDRAQVKHLIYTGPIDGFYDYCYGKLPYRSLRFEMESFSADQLQSRLPISGKPGFWQPAMQVNYPNEELFTRIVEIKHATGQQCPSTTIVREYPQAHTDQTEPYYPIPNPQTAALYKKYEDRAGSEKSVSFVGRLATYRYLNMDQVVGFALREFERIAAADPHR